MYMYYLTMHNSSYVETVGASNMYYLTMHM